MYGTPGFYDVHDASASSSALTTPLPTTTTTTTTTTMALNHISGSSTSTGPQAGPSDPASSLRAAALLTLKSKRRKPTADQPLGHTPQPPQPHLPPLRVLRTLAPSDSFQLDYGQGLEDPPPSASMVVEVASTTASVMTPATTKASPTTTIVSTPAAPDGEDDQIREEGEISDTDASPPPPPVIVAAASKLTNPLPLKESPISAGSDAQAFSTRLSSPRSASVKLEPTSQPTGDTLNAATSAAATCVSSSPSVVAFSDSIPVDIPHYILDADHVRPGLTMTQPQYDKAKEVVLDLLGWGCPPEDLTLCCSREIVYYVFNELNLRPPSNLDITGLIPYPVPPEVILPIPVRSQVMAPPQSTLHTRVENDARPQPSLPQRPTTRAKKKATAIAAAAAAGSALPAGSPTTALAESFPGTSRQSPPQSPAAAAVPSLHDMEQQRRQELLARKAVQASRKPKPAAEDAHEDGDGEVGGLVREVSVDDFLKSIAPVADAECRDSMQDTPEPMDVDEPDGAAQVSEAEGGGGRRGMKRPVAADFVDFEGTGGRTSSEPRRKTGSFASVSGMRRCVIDLSDSEDDGGFVEEDGVRGIEQNGWGTPPRGVTPGVGAEVLMEKEEEIRRMREIIAEKEERRLKKLSSRAGHGPDPVYSEGGYRSVLSGYRGRQVDGVVCRYVIPGGGECADEGCLDVHVM